MIYVFVGPSLPAETVLELLPEASVRPPIKHGDLFRLDPRAGEVVAIVDGLFHHEIAIRHKEILDVLARGVHVHGASSMGALRAAELHAYGMVGVGTIFHMLASGEIDGDDEVSLAHAPASDGYRPLSEALVDIRLHCRQAVEARILTERDARTIVTAASELAYDERAYPRVLGRAKRHGLTAGASAAYSTFVEREGRSAKREDALELIRRLRTSAATARREGFELAHTQWLHHWRQSLAGSRDASETSLPDRVVLSFIRIAARDYPALHERVALEELGAFYSEHLGLRAPAAAELVDDFRRAHELHAGDAWDAWCAEHRLREAELAASLRRGAHLRALTRTSGQLTLERLRELAGEYAVALGLWPASEPPEAQLALWLTARERERLSTVEQVARVAVRTFRIHPDTTHDEPFLAELKWSGAFARAHATLLDRPPLPDARPRRSSVLDWCAMRWGVHAVTPLDILDRGLDIATRYAQGRSLHDTFVNRARRFYARVEASGDFPLLSVATKARPSLRAERA